MHYDGVGWSSDTTPGFPSTLTFYGLTGTSANDVWAYAGSTIVRRAVSGGHAVDAGTDASSDGGNAQCSDPSLPAQFNCTSRPGSTCAGCLQSLAGGDSVCACLSGTAKSSCQALLSCMSPVFFSCAITGTCFCSNATCSNGADGRCASQFETVAGTTDPAQVIAQLNDPSSTVARLAQEAAKLGHTAACGIYCGCL